MSGLGTGFYVVIPSSSHSEQLQLAAEKAGWTWMGGEKAPIHIDSEILSFRNDKHIRKCFYKKDAPKGIPEQLYEYAESFFSFKFISAGVVYTPPSDCSCDGHTLLHHGCLCKKS